MKEFTDLDEIWFVVSPNNPLKSNHPCFLTATGFNLVDLAIGDRRNEIVRHRVQPPFSIYTIAQWHC
jgi:nicotinic acid mononucleotide adenylyltransferase